MLVQQAAIELEPLAPYRGGLVLADLVNELRVFPDPSSWSAWMRRPLLALPSDDAALIRKRLRPILRDPGDVLAEYL